MTRVGTMPIAGGRAIVTGVGQGVSGIGHGVIGVGQGLGHGVGKATHLFGRKDKENGSIIMEEEASPAAPIPRTRTASTIATNSVPGSPETPTSASLDGSRETGYLRVRVVSAKDLAGSDSIKPEVHLRVGEKEFKTKHAKGLAPDWDETFPFMITPAIKTLKVSVLDHKTIGKDKELAEADIDIWQYIANASTSDSWVDLSPQGQLHVRLEYSPGGGGPGGLTPPRSSMSITGLKVGSPAKASPSRLKG